VAWSALAWATPPRERAPRERLYVPVYSTNVAMLRGMVVNKVFPAPNMGALEKRWIPLDGEFAQHMAIRRAIYAKRPRDVFAVQRGYDKRVRAASQELLDDLVRSLITDHPDHYRMEGTRIHDLQTGFSLDLADPELHPLVKAGLLTQDDLTVNLPDRHGKYRLVAGFVATPTHWQVHDFLGKTVDEIHSKIPGYEKRLKIMLERLLPNLKVGKDRIRNNWFIETNHDLSMPKWRHRSPPFADRYTRKDVGRQVVLRSELETLFRLPVNQQAMIFTIRPRVWTMDFVKQNAPEIAWQIREALATGGSGYARMPWRRAMRGFLADLTPPPAEDAPAEGAPAAQP
jgi:hypothetical protein